MLKKLLNMLFCKFEIIDKLIEMELTFLHYTSAVTANIHHKLSLILFFKQSLS